MGTIKATIQTERYRGPVAKGITVTTNDPQRGTLQLTVRLDIAGSVTLLPGQVLTVGNLRGRPGPARMLVRKDPSETGTLRIGGLRASVPWLGVRAVEVGPDGAGGPVEGAGEARPGDWIVEAQVQGEPPDGARSLTVTFETGLSREPTVSVPVQVLWRPAIRFSSPSVVLDPGAGAPPPLLVSFRPDVDVRGATVTAEPEGLEARLETANAQAMHVRLRWAAASPPPTEGRVTVRAGSDSATAAVRFSNVPAAATPAR